MVGYKSRIDCQNQVGVLGVLLRVEENWTIVSQKELKPKVKRGISNSIEGWGFPTVVSYPHNVDMGKLNKLLIFLNNQSKVGQAHLILDFCCHPTDWLLLILRFLNFDRALYKVILVGATSGTVTFLTVNLKNIIFIIIYKYTIIYIIIYVLF